jgi:hypothetical protein
MVQKPTQLETTMMKTNEENKLAVKAALLTGAERGEHALLAIAEVGGDEAAREIVESLTDAEVAAVAGEFDVTIPSLVHGFATPEQFQGAFEKFGQRWPIIGNKEEMWGALRARQRELEAFLCPMICQADDTRATAMLAAFSRHELAADALVFIGWDRPGFQERLHDPTNSVTTRGTFEEIYARASEAAPELWEEVKLLAADLEDEDGALVFAKEFCAQLHDAGTEEDEGANLPDKGEETFLSI